MSRTLVDSRATAMALVYLLSAEGFVATWDTTATGATVTTDADPLDLEDALALL